MPYLPTIEKALAYLQAADIPAYYKKITPFQKILWRKGIAIPPTILADFKSNALIFGISGGIAWLLVHAILPLQQPQTWGRWLFSIIFFTVVFGCSMADYYRRQRRKFGLPSWQEIQNTP
jgi:hypothetical protein